MTLMRWRPLNDMVNTPDEMSRAFDGLLPRSGRSACRSWWPAVDVMETEAEFQFVVELPGLQKEDVTLAITDNVLTLKGEKKARVVQKNENRHLTERSYGAFERSFKLSAPVAAAAIRARFENGLLTVTVPKSDEAKPREISIDV